MPDKTPSTVMYDDFKAQGIKHIDTAQILFNLEYKFGGRSMADRLKRRTDLSRFYVHVEPGRYDRNFFSDFKVSTDQIAGRLLKAAGKRRPNRAEDLENHYLNTAAGAMQRALADYGIDPAPYRNAIVRIANGSFPGEHDRFTQCLMLFIVTGCLGDPRVAVRYVDDYAERHLGAVAHTIEAQSGAGMGVDEPADYFTDLPIGIIRILDGVTMKADHSLHVLSEDEVTVIGSGDCDITDVDAQVSRRHARVWKQDGHWYIEGMKSTNGITVINGSDKTVQVVEPPKSQRQRGYRPEPFEILPADTICLGESTRYMVRLVDVG